MGIEIERKFLVANGDWRARASKSLSITQGYLAREAGKASVRVRLEGDAGTLNIKAAVLGAQRAEYEYGIPATDARALLDTLCVATLAKVRHHVEHAGHLWEVDEFLGDNAPLVVAEIELDDAGERFERPGWLGREVTDEQRYYNHHLALHPWSTWPPTT
jgi:adenylate cyclase